ncbi:hypothetical protein [Streptosporangium sp. CA-115845]|uniref:hypothetical protein n=1 Tax=Streptosporangium sp. CA-115845 TaxID=3240071 RepID=UPI003D8EE5F9
MAARRYPTVSEAEGLAAIQQIIDRRITINDPGRDRLSDHPLELVSYVLAHQRVPRDVLQDDILLGLRIVFYARARVPTLPGEIDRLAERLARLGLDMGLTYRQLSVPLKLTRQGVEVWLKREASARRGRGRHESHERAAQLQDAQEIDWFTQYGELLLTGARRFVATHEAAGEEVAYWLEGLRGTLEKIPAGTRGDLTSMQRIAAGMRLVLDAVQEDDDEGFAAAVGDLIQEMTQLTAEHNKIAAV